MQPNSFVLEVTTNLDDDTGEDESFGITDVSVEVVCPSMSKFAVISNITNKSDSSTL